MNSEPLTMIRSWNRTILNLYWIMVAFVICSGQIINYIADRTSPWTIEGFADPALITMGIALISLLLMAELLLHYTNHMFDYVLIFVGFIVAVIINLTAGRSVHGLQIALEIPILVSMFYFNSKRLWFAGLMTLIGFVILYSLMANLRNQVSPYDLISITGMITGTSVIGHAVRLRGMELLQSLERAVSTGKELFVDTITLEFASKKDHLTGLYNHITFHEYLNTLIQQHETNGLPLQLAIVDIDDFKQINDTFGHHYGDEVLRKLSSLLNASITIDDFVARYGGEEFTLILTGKSLDQSLQIVEGIRESIANADFPELGHRIVTVSIGIAEYVKGLGKDSLFQQADAVLYQAKRQGKNKTMSDFGKESHNGY